MQNYPFATGITGNNSSIKQHNNVRITTTSPKGIVPDRNSNHPWYFIPVYELDYPGNQFQTIIKLKYSDLRNAFHFALANSWDFDQSFSDGNQTQLVIRADGNNEVHSIIRSPEGALKKLVLVFTVVDEFAPTFANVSPNRPRQRLIAYSLTILV